MITVCCWKWNQPGYRSQFTAEHVNVLRNMVERHLSVPHEFVCITDEPDGIDKRVRIVPMPKFNVPEWPPEKPNCFRRLIAFSDLARDVLGNRIVSIDLDCVITGSLDPLFCRQADFIICRDTAYFGVQPPRKGQYNGSMWIMTAGSRKFVWDIFIGDTKEALDRLKKSQLMGSDQAWISHVTSDEEVWTERDGVYSFRNQIMKLPDKKLPDNARIVFFHGKLKAWDEKISNEYKWIKEYYK